MKRIIVFAVLALLPAMRLHAQANPDSVKHRNECRLALQVLVKGEPARLTGWAINYVRSCGRDTWAQGAAAARRVGISPAGSLWLGLSSQ
jgi:hypothetical protein